jgi:flagellar assembly factor FliW
MHVETTRFGPLEVPDEAAITFPEGLIGFETCTRFAIVDRREGKPVWWLQSLDSPGVAFILTDPRAVVAEYKPTVPASDLEELGLESPDQAVFQVMLVVGQNPKTITANLLGPLVINSAKRLGKQIVLHNSGYSPAHRLTQLAPAGAPGGTEEGGGR